MKTVKVALTEAQLEVFQSLADQVNAGFTAGDVLLGLALARLEINPMIESSGQVHLEIAYYVARAKAGVIQAECNWEIAVDEDDKDEVAAARKEVAA